MCVDARLAHRQNQWHGFGKGKPMKQRLLQALITFVLTAALPSLAKRCVFGLLLSVMILVGSGGNARASGVTVITHGFQLFGNYPAWTDTMAQAVIDKAGNQGLGMTWYHVRIYKSGGNIVSTIVRKPNASSTPQGEIVVTVDWSDVSNHLLSAGVTTDQVAYELATVLRNPYPAIGLTLPLASKTLHLIGHSRGGSVMLETAHLLGKSGIWVDHLTTLDPHPLTSPDYGIYPNGCAAAYCFAPIFLSASTIMSSLPTTTGAKTLNGLHGRSDRLTSTARMFPALATRN